MRGLLHIRRSALVCALALSMLCVGPAEFAPERAPGTAAARMLAPYLSYPATSREDLVNLLETLESAKTAAGREQHLKNFMNAMLIEAGEQEDRGVFLARIRMLDEEARAEIAARWPGEGEKLTALLKSYQTETTPQPLTMVVRMGRSSSVIVPVSMGRPVEYARSCAALKAARVPTQYLDCAEQRLEPKKLAQMVKETAARQKHGLVVALSAIPNDDDFLYDFLKCFSQEEKERLKIVLAVTGYMPSQQKAEFFDRDPPGRKVNQRRTKVDFLLNGEAERLPAAIRVLGESGLKIAALRAATNVIFHNADGETVVRPHRVLSEAELGELAMPDWTIFHSGFFTQDGKAQIDTSRGCPMACQYCGGHSFYDERGDDSGEPLHTLLWRAMPAEKVVDEIEFMVKEYGVKLIDFTDDDFIADYPERAAEIARLLIERGLHREIRFFMLARTDEILADGSDELFALLRQAGLARITIGTENFNEETLKYFGKGTTKQRNMDAIRKVQRMLPDVELTIGLINFHRDVTAEKLQENAEAIRELGVHRAVPGMTNKLVLVEGTKSHQRALREKWDIRPAGKMVWDYDILDERAAAVYRALRPVSLNLWPTMKYLKIYMEGKYYGDRRDPMRRYLSRLADQTYTELRRYEFELFEEMVDEVVHVVQVDPFERERILYDIAQRYMAEKVVPCVNRFVLQLYRVPAMALPLDYRGDLYEELARLVDQMESEIFIQQAA